jgi:hypothetical protein
MTETRVLKTSNCPGIHSCHFCNCEIWSSWCNYEMWEGGGWRLIGLFCLEYEDTNILQFLGILCFWHRLNYFIWE